MSTQDYLSGKLLIAMPNMTDPRFEGAVIFLLNHDASHAFGLVVNKPRKSVMVGDVLQALDITPAPEATSDIAEPSLTRTAVFDGGPVDPSRGLVLHSLDYVTEGTFTPVCGVLGATGDEQVLREIAGETPPAKWLFATGSAGWSAGQLETEIAANVWLHLDADEDLIFSATPEKTWRRALQTLNVTEAMFSDAWSDVRDGNALLN